MSGLSSGRSGHGMENIEIAFKMWKNYGTPSKPLLTGLSVHSQRIERLWKDVLHYVLHYYIDLFYSMEGNETLDPLDEVWNGLIVSKMLQLNDLEHGAYCTNMCYGATMQCKFHAISIYHSGFQ